MDNPPALTPEQAAAAIQFLGRVQLVGTEAPMLMAIIRALYAVAHQTEQP